MQNQLKLLNHPFYQAWMQGTIPMPVLQNYAKQYYFHVDRFPRYLSALHSICEDSASRKDLLQNLNDEEGTFQNHSHPELWLQFSEGLGVTRDEVKAAIPGPAIRHVADLFFQLTRRSYHEGLGALYAYESQIPEIATSKIAGLKKQYQIVDPKTLEFFMVHETADLEHRRVIEKLLNGLPAGQKREAQEASRQMAQALWGFLTEIHGQETACA